MCYFPSEALDGNFRTHAMVRQSERQQRTRQVGMRAHATYDGTHDHEHFDAYLKEEVEAISTPLESERRR